jgi:hypothetical protein
LDLHLVRPYVVIVQCNKDFAMAKKTPPTQEVRPPDLLAALTARGLGAPRRLPADERPARPKPALRSWIERIGRFFDWLNVRVAEHDRLRREAYLAQASDHCDLEYRIRELERPSVVRGGW